MPLKISKKKLIKNKGRKKQDPENPVFMIEIISLVSSSFLFPQPTIKIGNINIKNIVEFDKEYGNFFTKDDCYMLRIMHRFFLHCAH